MVVSKKKSGKAPRDAVDGSHANAADVVDAHAADIVDAKLDKKTAKIVKKKLAKIRVQLGSDKKSRPIPQVDPEATVVYLGHLPYGFYETQIKGFLSQFGDVGRLRVSRSPKTARSRGFAFIEFFHKEVAEIVVDTMHNYLLFGKLLKCHIVEKEKVHPEIWKNADKTFRRIPRDKIAAARHNRVRTDEQVEARAHTLCVKEDKLKRKLATLEIDYTFPGYTDGGTVRPKKQRKKALESSAGTATPNSTPAANGKKVTGKDTKKKGKKSGKAPSSAKSATSSETVEELPSTTPKATKNAKNGVLASAKKTLSASNASRDTSSVATPKAKKSAKKTVLSSAKKTPIASNASVQEDTSSVATPKVKKSAKKSVLASAKKTPSVSNASVQENTSSVATPKAQKGGKKQLQTDAQTPGPATTDANHDVATPAATPKATPKSTKVVGRANTPAAKSSLALATPKGKASAKRIAPASSAKKISRKKTRSKTKVALSEDGAFVSPVRTVASTSSTAPPSSKKKRMQ